MNGMSRDMRDPVRYPCDAFVAPHDTAVYMCSLMDHAVNVCTTCTGVDGSTSESPTGSDMGSQTEQDTHTELLNYTDVFDDGTMAVDGGDDALSECADAYNAMFEQRV
jgi:hypothetical protein